MSGSGETIWVVEEDSLEGSGRGLFGEEGFRKRALLDAPALKAQMRDLLRVVGEIFDQKDVHSGMQLSEVELGIEINTEGQVSLVGTSGKALNRGAITLKFTRSES
jgi:hypothetical protein